MPARYRPGFTNHMEEMNIGEQAFDLVYSCQRENGSGMWRFKCRNAIIVFEKTEFGAWYGSIQSLDRIVFHCSSFDKHDVLNIILDHIEYREQRKPGWLAGIIG
jgi:hypothetical protein